MQNLVCSSCSCICVIKAKWSNRHTHISNCVHEALPVLTQTLFFVLPVSTCMQIFGFLVTGVYGVNTFLAVRRWRRGNNCQGAAQTSEYMRARTASRGEMEARPELAWVQVDNQTWLKESHSTGSWLRWALLYSLNRFSFNSRVKRPPPSYKMFLVCSSRKCIFISQAQMSSVCGFVALSWHKDLSQF